MKKESENTEKNLPKTNRQKNHRQQYGKTLDFYKETNLNLCFSYKNVVRNSNAQKCLNGKDYGTYKTWICIESISVNVIKMQTEKKISDKKSVFAPFIVLSHNGKTCCRSKNEENFF